MKEDKVPEVEGSSRETLLPKGGRVTRKEAKPGATQNEMLEILVDHLVKMDSAGIKTQFSGNITRDGKPAIAIILVGVQVEDHKFVVVGG